MGVCSLLKCNIYFLIRYFVIYNMPNLAFLDSKPVTAQERKEAKRVGEFTKIVRPSDEVVRHRGGGGEVWGGGGEVIITSFLCTSVSSCRKEIAIC